MLTGVAPTGPRFVGPFGHPALREEPTKRSGWNTQVYNPGRRNAKKRIRFKQVVVFPMFRHKEALCNPFRGIA